MLDAEDAAQGAFQVAGVGFGHAVGVVHKAHEGRRFAFGLGQVEELGANAAHHRA